MQGIDDASRAQIDGVVDASLGVVMVGLLDHARTAVFVNDTCTRREGSVPVRRGRGRRCLHVAERAALNLLVHSPVAPKTDHSVAYKTGRGLQKSESLRDLAAL